MVVIGITGNTGSGKTTVSTIIKNNLNCTVISADYIAKKINVQGSKYYEETIELFGNKILKEDGTIDRRILAEIIFSDSELKKKLNKITAKYVGNEIENIVKEEKEKNKKKYIVTDATLLFQCRIDKLCDYIIAVVCENKEIKIRRIVSRDKLTRNQAEARLNAQPNNDFYISQSDIVIYNNPDISYFVLIKEVLKVVHRIKKGKIKKREK